MTADLYAPEPRGKTEKLIPRVREMLGDRLTLEADANGYSDVAGAIRTGRTLPEYKFARFEEPVMYDRDGITATIGTPIAMREYAAAFPPKIAAKLLGYCVNRG